MRQMRNSLPLPAVFGLRLIDGRWFAVAAGQPAFPFQVDRRRHYAASRSRSRRRTTAIGLKLVKR